MKLGGAASAVRLKRGGPDPDATVRRRSKFPRRVSVLGKVMSIELAPSSTAGAGPSTGQPVNVYTPESQLRSPAKLARSMVRDLAAARHLAWRLFVRDISARYRQSALGVLWAFLPPVVTAVTFITLNRAAVINVGATAVPYPVFVLFGAVFWQLFSESLAAPLKAVEGSKSMLAKINFPREALIISGAGQVLFDFGIRAVILAVFLAVYRIPPTWGLLLLPFAVLALLTLGTVIGLLLTPVGALYSDVSAALPTVTGLWFFLTPVVYPAPTRWPYSLLSQVNPVSPLLNAARDLATRGTIQDPLLFLAESAATVVGLCLMWVLYRMSLPILIERMSA